MERDTDYYGALRAMEPKPEKLTRFLTWLDELRSRLDDLPLPELGQALMAQALAAGPGDNITLVLIEITALDAETAVPLPQPPAEELSQTRRFEVPAARIAEQETQRKKHAHARRREIILTVAVVLAVLAAVILSLIHI